MYTVKQVAAWKKVSESTVASWIRDKKLKAKKDKEGKWMIYESSLKALTKKQNSKKSSAKSNPPKPKKRKTAKRKKKAAPKSRKRRFAWDMY